MREKHIIELLDAAPFRDLTEDQLSRIRDHADHCPDCQEALQAAQISSLLLHREMATVIEPSPFFKTKLMATIRERQAATGAFSLSKVWNSAGILVSSMAASVLILAALSVSWPDSEPQEHHLNSTASKSTEVTDWVVLDADLPVNAEMSYGQLLTDIYYPESERESTDGNRQ